MAKGQGYRPITSHLHTSDVDHTFVVADNTGSVRLINGIANGSADDERTGKMILMKSLALRYHVSMASPDKQPVGSTMLICIIKDLQPQATLPSYTDIFTTNESDSFFNLSNSGRFKSVYRRVIHAGPGSVNAVTSSAANSVYNVAWTQPPIDEVWKNLDHSVRYDGDANGVLDIFDCAYYLVTHCDYHAVVAHADNQWTFNAKTRIRYHDI